MPGQGTRTQYGAPKPKPKHTVMTVPGSTGNINITDARRERFIAANPDATYTDAAARGWEDYNYGVRVGDIPFPSTSIDPNSGSSGGGRRYGGGGGGGGGGGALTQSTIDAMLRVLGATPGGVKLQQYNAPAFRGRNIAAFNPQMYTDLSNQLATAKQTDLANVQQGQQNVTNTLQQNYQNAYANPVMPQTPTPQVQGNAGLAASAGGDTGAQQAAVNQGNAGAMGGQQAFQNLMQVLAATDQTAQNSRMNQVAMDANYANQNIGAQATGLQGTIGMARNQAQQQWAQQDQERRYQNSLMAQQWAREQAMNNTQLANTQATTNWQQQQTNLQARMQPLLDMISQGNGVSGLNMGGIQQLLARLTGRAAA